MKKVVLIILIPIVCVVLLFLMVCFAFPKKYESVIDEYANKYGVEKSIVYAVINVESGFDTKTVSRVGAIGLMQIMPTTAEDCAKKLQLEDVDLYDVETNIKIGCYYISYLMKLFDGNIKNVLSAYNWGLGNVNDWIKEGNVDEYGSIENVPVNETRMYYVKCKINMWVYKNLRGVNF